MTDLSLPSSPPTPIALVLQPVPAALPQSVAAWIDHQPVTVVSVAKVEELMVYALRSRPRFIVIDGRSGTGDTLAASRRIKRDPYTGVVPVVYVAPDGVAARIDALSALADEVVSNEMDDVEAGTRLRCLLLRSDRDVGVHPSTRLPGAPAARL